MESFQSELGVKFEYKLENSHVIDPKQVFLSILSKGKDNIPFNFSYQNRDNQMMWRDLGNSVIRIAEKTPGGILMFFPSYRVLESTYQYWLDSNIMYNMEKSKVVLREPKDAS